jgi:hypothetical protein
MTRCYSILWIVCHPSIKEHLSAVQFLVIVNNAVMNTHVQVFVHFSGTHLEEEFLGHCAAQAALKLPSSWDCSREPQHLASV